MAVGAPPLVVIGAEGLWGTVLTLLIIYPLAYHVVPGAYHIYELLYHIYECITLYISRNGLRWDVLRGSLRLPGDGAEQPPAVPPDRGLRDHRNCV